MIIMIDIIEIAVSVLVSFVSTLLLFSTPLGVGYFTLQSSQRTNGPKPVPTPTYAATGVRWS